MNCCNILKFIFELEYNKKTLHIYRFYFLLFFTLIIRILYALTMHWVLETGLIVLLLSPKKNKI